MKTNSSINILKTFSYAFNGLRILFKEERNAWIHMAAAITANALGIWYHLASLEWVALWVCIGMVFLTELLNTALENLCDLVSPEKNVIIGKVKDLAAAAVLISALVSVIIALFIFVPKFF